MNEEQQQEMLFSWAAYVPELKWLFAVPNGQYRPKPVAIKLKRQGVKAGVSDIMLPRPNKHYHGLYIEMKYGKNKPSDKQKDFLRYVNDLGYCGVVCYGFEAAKSVIERYLNNENLEDVKF